MTGLVSGGFSVGIVLGIGFWMVSIVPASGGAGLWEKG